jgi:hypothetical protein
MPTLTVAFLQKASTAVARSQKGTVAMVLRDATADTAAATYTLTSAAQIPTTLGTDNQAAIKRVFLGNGNAPKKVLLYVTGAKGSASETAVTTWLSTQQFDYLVGPPDISTTEATAYKTWIINQRNDNRMTYKAVLPNVTADCEGVINFNASNILVSGTKYTAAAYCGRIAGLIAGTPMTQSITYAPLPEVEDIERQTAAAMDTAVGKGQLVLMHDGEKVKCGRGVNSLTTVTGKSDIWKKIKIVELLDMVQQDIRLTIQDNYIGKMPNSYDNKVQLITAISGYLQSLAKDELIESTYTCEIDTDAQDTWLKSNGVATVSMSEQEIKEANTGSNVFLKVAITPIDAMEDVAVKIYL